MARNEKNEIGKEMHNTCRAEQSRVVLPLETRDRAPSNPKCKKQSTTAMICIHAPLTNYCKISQFRRKLALQGIIGHIQSRQGCHLAQLRWNTARELCISGQNRHEPATVSELRWDGAAETSRANPQLGQLRQQTDRRWQAAGTFLLRCSSVAAKRVLGQIQGDEGVEETELRWNGTRQVVLAQSETLHEFVAVAGGAVPPAHVFGDEPIRGIQPCRVAICAVVD
mmetsp:Transcript_10659/g.29413  ORF Transcript_10659/g.29413 Transcript_10659/m.29413 type:complete len:225 (+) Transcript_10659:84-758(+)